MMVFKVIIPLAAGLMIGGIFGMILAALVAANGENEDVRCNNDSIEVSDGESREKKEQEE